MMDAKTAHDFILPAGLQHLPERLDTIEARAMLLAIGLQESDFKHRVQLIGNHRHWWDSLRGPARGWWQFERAGVTGVLRHRATADHAATVLERLRYPDEVGMVHKALAHNDPLAAVFARLLLFTVPNRLPRRDEANEAWRQYTWAWRPGKPHPARWPSRYAEAWRIAAGES